MLGRPYEVLKIGPLWTRTPTGQCPVAVVKDSTQHDAEVVRLRRAY